MTRRLTAWALPALLVLVFAVGACRRDPPPAESRAAGDPVAAVRGLADALKDDDLVRWSRLSLPPELHARREQAWVRRQQLAEPPTPEDSAEFRKMMSRLTAPDAEEALLRDLEPKLRKFEGEFAGQWPLMQATLTIFLNAAIEANTELTDVQKAHGTEVAKSLMDWLQPALVADRDRARKAIASLAKTARRLDLDTLEQTRALPMLPALEKGGIALGGIKEVAAIYGVDVNRMLSDAEIELVSAKGDEATVKVTYPLLDRKHSFEMPMVRRDGSWYSADAIAEAEADLAELERETTAAATPDAAPAGAAD